MHIRVFILEYGSGFKRFYSYAEVSKQNRQQKFFFKHFSQVQIKISKAHIKAVLLMQVLFKLIVNRLASKGWFKHPKSDPADVGSTS